MSSIDKFVYIAHHFISLRLNPFGLRVDRKGCWFEYSMLQFRVGLSAEGAKDVSWFWLSRFRGWGSVNMTSTGKFVCTAHHFILLCLNPFGLKVNRDGSWVYHSMSQLRIFLSAEGAKIISYFWLSPLRRWGSLIMTSIGKCVYMAHHFILLRLNRFALRVDREGWWFEHSMSQLQVRLSADCAKTVSWHWLAPLRGWGSLTMTPTGIFAYMAHHFMLLWLKSFGVMVDREGWQFEHSMSWLRVCLSADGAKNLSRFWLFPLRRWGSLTMTSTYKVACMAHHFILLRLNPFGIRVDRDGWQFEHSM